MEIPLFETSPDSDRISVEADAVELDLSGDEFSIDGPVRVDLCLNRNENIVYVKLTARASVVLSCARCLETFNRDIEGSVSFVVRRLKLGETAAEPGKEGEDRDEDSLIIIKYNERSIDIDDFVRDAVILAIPLKPVCREECRGLCPVCGMNINEGDCNCVEERSDPRWQSLSELMKKNPEK